MAISDAWDWTPPLNFCERLGLMTTTKRMHRHRISLQQREIQNRKRKRERGDEKRGNSLVLVSCAWQCRSLKEEACAVVGKLF